MDARVETYIRRGKFYVDGWLRKEAARTIVALDARQRSLAVEGGVLEIGVHHGKLFILLYLLCRPPYKAVAIDLFEDQHLNVDQSGNGDLARLKRNLERHADRARLVLHQGSSTELSAEDLVRLGEARPRLVSVDGGHTAEIAAHDLATASEAIVEGGIIVVDDVFNERWPGVVDGVHRFFARRPDLVPFAIGANKTYFCRPSYRDIYYDTVVAASPAATATEFLGQPVAFLDFQYRPGLKEAVVQTAAWRSLRTTPIGRPLRWAWHAGRTLRRGLMRNEGF
ncbi:MAG: class I SAM-dependent methyltransferase [Pseudomonadota bacterium]